ncbi:MAG: hypothetical protein D6729_05050, partial [Deltaproteobacteria bacterium]
MTSTYAFDLPVELVEQLRRYRARLAAEMPGVTVDDSVALRLALSRVLREEGLARRRTPPPKRRLLR